MRLPALLVATLLLAGCATLPRADGTEWSKPRGSLAQTTLDEAACASDTRHAGATLDLGVGGLVDLVRVPLGNARRMAAYRGCMTARGYGP